MTVITSPTETATKAMQTSKARDIWLGINIKNPEALEILESIANSTHSSRAVQANAFAVSAAINYRLGRTVTATRVARSALRINPDHTLARLVYSAITTQLPAAALDCLAEIPGVETAGR